MKKVNKILLALGSVASLSTLPLVAAKCGEPAKKPEVKTKLSEVIKETNLGEISTKNEVPSEKEISDAIKSKNQQAKDLTLSIKDTTKTNAKVTSEKHEGEVEVKFTTKKETKEEPKEENKEEKKTDLQLFESNVLKVEENFNKIKNFKLKDNSKNTELNTKFQKFLSEVDGFKLGVKKWFDDIKNSKEKKLTGRDSVEVISKRATYWLKLYIENKEIGFNKKYSEIKSIFKDQVEAESIKFEFK